MTIFRDDDISYKTDLKRFTEIHNLFIKYDVLHTISLICKDIQKNIPLIAYINSNKIDVQVHCYEHYDLTTDPARLKKDLPKCIKIIEKYFYKIPDTLYPPWNKTSGEVEAIAKENGLIVRSEKCSLSYYLANEWKISIVINFHSWSDECDQLEDALHIYTSKVNNLWRK